jgi:hypothetical protein
MGISQKISTLDNQRLVRRLYTVQTLNISCPRTKGSRAAPLGEIFDNGKIGGIIVITQEELPMEACVLAVIFGLAFGFYFGILKEDASNLSCKEHGYHAGISCPVCSKPTTGHEWLF